MSPFNQWAATLDVDPPGQDPTISRPRVGPGGIAKTQAKKAATAGMIPATYHHNLIKKLQFASSKTIVQADAYSSIKSW